MIGSQRMSKMLKQRKTVLKTAAERQTDIINGLKMTYDKKNRD